MTVFAVSPYHMTTREPPAMAALLLAGRVVTLMPGVNGSVGGRQGVRTAAETSTRYAALLDSWTWSMPLWQAGLVDSAFDGDDGATDLDAVFGRIAHDDRFLALRAFMQPGLADDRKRMIESVAADVLKGGPDPAICVPLAAGLDRFAARHGMIVARASPMSVAQRAEAELAEPLLTTVVPMILQATAVQMLQARTLLDRPLARLRNAIARPEGPVRTEVSEAAAELDRVFASTLAELAGSADRRDPPLMWGPVSLTMSRLPADAVLSSSVAAARALVGSRVVDESNARAGTLPAVMDQSERATILAMVVKPLGRPTRVSHAGY